MNTLRMTAAAATAAVALTLAACGSSGSTGETDTSETTAPSPSVDAPETSEYTPGPLLDDRDVDGNTAVPDGFQPDPAPLGESDDPFGGETTW